ncbi:MAG: DUF4097 domain-containing protein [Clostridia bacterium]|nr:DUF4097 domain-containing protein [Clostridia bacterium]
MKIIKKCAVLCAAAGCALALVGCGGHGLVLGGKYTYDNASRYLAGNGSFDAASVRELSVEWIAGDVILREGEGDSITFTETTTETDENYLLHYSLDGGDLKIRFQNSGTKIKSNFSKSLVIEYPAGHSFGEVEIDTASARVDVSGITARELDVDTASGGVSLGCKSVNDVNVDTASGKIDIHGAFSKAECDSASGSVTLTFPQDVGFSVKFKSASGKVNNSTAATQQGKSYVLGNGQVLVEVDTASGSLTLKQEPLVTD